MTEAADEEGIHGGPIEAPARGTTAHAASLASVIGISLSYLNQLENNQRPLTLPVVLKLNAAFGVDVQLFSDDDEARLIADLRETLTDPLLGETISTAELRELAINMPAVGRALVGLNRRYRQAIEQTAALAARLGEDRQAETAILPSTPYEEVRDFFYARHNYIAELDEAAERLAEEFDVVKGDNTRRPRRIFAQRIRRQCRYRQRVSRRSSPVRSPNQDPASFPQAGAGPAGVQLATQIAMLGVDKDLAALVDGAGFTNAETRGLARIGLANYFAGALLMPYRKFLGAAKELHYDIDLLGQEFGVGFETICHRLSTLQRQAERGVPFFFIRVDRAGNISKRQSATDFQFSRIGGTCPLWNVYEAFSESRTCPHPTGPNAG